MKRAKEKAKEGALLRAISPSSREERAPASRPDRGAAPPISCEGEASSDWPRLSANQGRLPEYKRRMQVEESAVAQNQQQEKHQLQKQQQQNHSSSNSSSNSTSSTSACKKRQNFSNSSSNNSSSSSSNSSS
ncbi:osteocalcin 2-like, partial [Bacillus rossius redtenbacheri]|uniref:osteocalcin 2-like n=1 Tax=Bacillus rossius redtenbacheri TaxID=93214 RepID=UPI002FDF0835